MKKYAAIIQIFFAFICGLNQAAADGTPDPVPEITALQGSVELSRTISLAVNNLTPWIEKNHADPNKLTLFLDGVALSALRPALIGGNSQINYSLDYLGTPGQENDANKQAWRQLLKTRRSDLYTRPITVSLGYEGKQFPKTLNTQLIVVNKNWFVSFAIVSLVLLVFFVALAGKSDILREPGDQPEGDRKTGQANRKPFSLARAQMAVWFFAVLISYLFIWIVSSDLSNLTPSVLGLIGISAATGLGAAAVDSSKTADLQNQLDSLTGLLNQDQVDRKKLQTEIDQINAAVNTLPYPVNLADLQASLATKSADVSGKEMKIAHGEAQIAQLNALLKPEVSQGFIKDILSDNGGVSFHRFQIFTWTIALIVIFISKVYNDLSMPDFDGNLLALMGISSGTYLGFKLPAKQG